MIGNFLNLRNQQCCWLQIEAQPHFNQIKLSAQVVRRVDVAPRSGSREDPLKDFFSVCRQTRLNVIKTKVVQQFVNALTLFACEFFPTCKQRNDLRFDAGRVAEHVLNRDQVALMVERSFDVVLRWVVVDIRVLTQQFQRLLPAARAGVRGGEIALRVGHFPRPICKRTACGLIGVDHFFEPRFALIVAISARQNIGIAQLRFGELW